MIDDDPYERYRSYKKWITQTKPKKTQAWIGLQHIPEISRQAVGEWWNKHKGFWANYERKQKQESKDNREAKTREEASKDSSRIQGARNNTNDGTGGNRPSSERRSQADVLRQIRRTKYGRIPPTFKQVEIKTLDQLVAWIQEFTPYMQGKWDNANTRENAKVLFFDVFIDGDSTLIGKPRDSGKSMVSTAVYICILANYWLPQSIIINGPKGKRRILKGINKACRTPRFREAYGDIMESLNRGEGFIELYPEFADRLYEENGYVSDDPSISVSVYNNIIGSHPYIAYLEDMLQSEFKSKDSNEYILYEVYDGIISKLTSRLGGTFTRKGMEDMYSHMPNRNVLLVIRPCIEKLTGEWPTEEDLIIAKNGRVTGINYEGTFKIIERPGWTVKSLLIMRTIALRETRSFEMFEREMQNNPIFSSGLYFEIDDWVVVPDLDYPTQIRNNCIIAVDPAFGKKTGADFFALLIGVVTDGYLHIVKTELKIGLSFDKGADMIFYYATKFKAKYTIVETTFWQALIFEKLDKHIPGLLPVTHSDAKKTHRIDTLDSPFARKRIKICEGMGNMKKAKDQFIMYDRTDSTPDRKDDWLDALEMIWNQVKWDVYGSESYSHMSQSLGLK